MADRKRQRILFIHDRPHRRAGFRIAVVGAWLAISLHGPTASQAEVVRTPDPAPQPADLWTSKVQPLLTRHCLRCHGALKQRSGLDLRTVDSLLEGGERGPAVVPGKPHESRLIQFIKPDADPHMPPGNEQLTESEISILIDWIRAGAQPGIASDTALADITPPDGAQAPPSSWVPPAGLSPALVIDLLIERGWQAHDVTPSPVCDDSTFVRRIYLDLAGRIPTPAETNAFLRDTRSQKRATLIDALLDSDDYARHMREVFDVVLMGRVRPDELSTRDDRGWFDYLEWAFRTNRRWDRIVHDVISARAESPETRPASWFLYERRNNHQAMVEAAAPAFLGVQVQCAQCHDHPLAPEIKQAHYWGLVAFLNRSRNVDTRQGPGVAELAIGGFVQFADLAGDSHDALLTFLDGRRIDEDRPAPDQQEVDDPQLYDIAPPANGDTPAAAAVPKFSRRAALAELMTDDNPRLGRSFVNRAWALLLGRGLVHPVDRMDSANPPSHPELLTWLAEDFEQSGYNVRRLVRSLVSSRTYQRSSRPAGDIVAMPDSFAYALPKPLSAEVLARSMLIATGHGPDFGATAPNIDERLLMHALTDVYPDLFADHYNPTLAQSLFLSNAEGVQTLTAVRPGNTTAKLLSLSDPAAQVDDAFRIVLGRKPTSDERSEVVRYLEQRRDRPVDAVRQVVWALLTSAEFMFHP